MLKEFNETFEDMICDRIEELDSVVIEDEEYDKLEVKINKIFYKIKEQLPEEHQRLISNYTKLYALQSALVQQLIYKQGFKDGLELKNILRLIG